ncbi:hypothetical protein [Halapricum desulfuricans]|uniref:Acetyltransferase (GNAT) family n=1 Tax=Halapricum desulfuricans TaxID=2841257 RepID=A0A897ND20_9EURY|nr:hypothetical protein [Halapricum desulfuricans]QSG08859.1 Acetyltransferase (GNAT) family [Halapricum desulfuricans]
MPVSTFLSIHSPRRTHGASRADPVPIETDDETGTRATTARVRQRERETGDGVETWAVYGHSVWDGPDAARALFEAVAADGVISDEPFFVLEADLTGSA